MGHASCWRLYASRVTRATLQWGAKNRSRLKSSSLSPTLWVAVLLMSARASWALSVCGDVVGAAWTLQDSPVSVTCDLDVAELSITEGVVVEFTGPYRVTVNGVIRVNGLRGEPVVFRSSADNMDGWRGFFAEDAAPGSVFEWFVIEDATESAFDLVRTAPTFSNGIFQNNRGTFGAAIRAQLSDTDLIVSRCHFRGNLAHNNGGAIHVQSVVGEAALVVEDSTFEGNRANFNFGGHNAAGGAIWVAGDSRIVRSTFRGNQANAYTIFTASGRHTSGGAIYTRDGSCEIVASLFSDNSCSMTAHGQTPDRSYTRGGAVFLQSGALRIENGLFNGNFLSAHRRWTFEGSAVYIAEGQMAVVNSTFAENSVDAAIHNHLGEVGILNSILFGNDGGDDEIRGDLTISYSNVQHEIYPGDGNISQNPIFDPHFRILPPSPSIDAGHPGAEYEDSVPPGLGSTRNDMGITGGSAGAEWERPLCYRDADEDGFGDERKFALLAECNAGYVADNTDCLDHEPTANPNGVESLDAEGSCSDSIDNDCDGLIDEMEFNCVPPTATATATQTATPSPSGAPSELPTLGCQNGCPGDLNGDRVVSVAELVRAVRSALDGCD